MSLNYTITDIGLAMWCIGFEKNANIVPSGGIDLGKSGLARHLQMLGCRHLLAGTKKGIME